MYHLLPYLRYEDGRPRTTRNPKNGEPNLEKGINEGLEAERNTIKYVSRKWETAMERTERRILALTLPSVVNFARNHFRCASLDAVDMESDGNDEGRSSHFERRLSVGEIMSPYSDVMQVVSGLTLNYFKDTGWYNVNLSMAGEWRWGQGQGCDFVLKSCFAFMKQQRWSQKTTSTWCDPSDYSNQGIKCLSYTNAYGSCNFANLTSALKPRYTHFDAPLSNVGGAEYLADHCPFFKTFDSVDHLHKNSHCGDTNNRRYEENNGIKYKQHYGKKSRCINYGIHYYSGVPKEIPVAGCYRVRCTLRFELKIFFKGVWYTCPKSGGRIVTMKDNTSEDWIECPSYRDICSEEDSDILKLQRNQSLQTVDSNRSIPSSDS
ncbi:unnamed protein product [Heterobilharzia americana]|nr:unnamed protein product [Heterobilharzia americana]